MKILSVIVFVFLLSNVFAQEKPNFFPEDITTLNSEAICYCKPGVVNKSRTRGLSLSYSVFYSGDYSTENDNGMGTGISELNDLSSFDFKIKIPLLLNDQTRVLLGYDYFFEQYDFENISGQFLETINTLNSNSLKSNGVSAILSHSLNEKNYLLFRYKFSANGNYDGFVEVNERNSIHNFLGMYGIKKNENSELGFGLLLSKNFRRTSAVPFVLYNRTFNEHWGLEAMLPANIFVRCNFDPLTLAVMGLEYGSKSFRIDVEDPMGTDPLGFAFNHSEIQLSFEVERFINSWVWANAKIGYQQNFSSDFETKTDFAPSFQADVQSGFFFQIGVFISPSSDIQEKIME